MQRFSHPVLRLVGLVVLSLAIAGCGGPGDSIFHSTDTAASPPTEAR